MADKTIALSAIDADADLRPLVEKLIKAARELCALLGVPTDGLDFVPEGSIPRLSSLRPYLAEAARQLNRTRKMDR